jgi:hypothetical protein
MRRLAPIVFALVSTAAAGCPRQNVDLGTPRDASTEDAGAPIDAAPPQPPDAGPPPRELIWLAAGPLESPWALALDANNAYVTGAAGDGRVLQIPLDGGPVVQIASTPGGSLWIAVDATDIYWLELQGLMKAPIGGGAVTTLASPPVGGSNALALDATNVYYTTRDGNVESVPKAGGPITVVATSQTGASGIATDGTTLWWANFADDGGIMSAPAGGGTPMLAETVPFARDGLALHGADLYYMSEASGAPYLARKPLAGGAPTMLANWSESGRAGNLATDGAHVWFWQPACAIGKVAVGGGAAEVHSYPGLGCPRFYAVDDTNLYFTTELGLARLPK